MYNHYKRVNTENDGLDEVELQKSNICLIGPTGSGKTFLAQTLARTLNVPFAIADATSLTEAGYVGEDVENILLKLLQAADYNVERAEKGIIYIDEIDNIIQIDTTNILFIVGGAFDGIETIVKNRLGEKTIGFGKNNKKIDEDASIMQQIIPEDLLKFGLIPEFIGRLPVTTALEKLTTEDLVRILTEPKNALVKQYQKLLSYDDTDLSFDADALNAIADKAIARNTGARGLRSIIEDVMMDVMFDIPSDESIEKVIVTKDSVEGSGKPIIEYHNNKKKAG